MALQRIVSLQICSQFFRPVISIQNYLKGTPSSSKPQNIQMEDDVLDTFTTELVQKTMDTWTIRNNKFKLLRCSSPEKISNINVMSMSKTQLNKIFTCVLHECNDSGVIQLLEDCLKYNICPNEDILLKVMYICAQNGKVQLIHNLEQLCKTFGINFSANFDFSLYEAHAIWMKGNAIKALEIFEKLYISNPFLRRRIKILLQKLMFDETKKNSEVVLTHIIKFSESIVAKYKDFFPMVCVWEVCFMSEWFSDQQIALELLLKNRRLGEVLTPRLPHILSLCLKHHQTEAVYRLLEILLSFDMKEHYTLVAMALLDYQFLRGNLRSYSEIIKWCQCKDVSLPCIYKEKYLQLLLKNQDIKKYLFPNENKKNDFRYRF